MKISTCIYVLGILVIVALFVQYRKTKCAKFEKLNDNYKKMSMYYHVFNKWLKLKQSGRKIEEYFKQNNYYTIAIYGYKELGERLYYELKDTDIEVKYIIDKNVDCIWPEIDSYGLDEQLPKVDAVVVTAPYYLEEIEAELYELIKCPIVSIEEIVI